MSLQSNLAAFVHAEVDHDLWSTHCLTARVTSQGADHSLAVTFDDKSIPDCSGVHWLGGLDLSVPAGTVVLVAIDANGSPWILGVMGQPATEPVPLGNALVSYLGALVDALNGHTHVPTTLGSPTGTMTASTPPTLLIAPSGLLSTTAKVIP